MASCQELGASTIAADERAELLAAADRLVDLGMTYAAVTLKFQAGDDTCSYEGCNRLATGWACGKIEPSYGDEHTTHPPLPARYCGTHQDKVANEGRPVYQTDCPHCGCAFGVE